MFPTRCRTEVRRLYQAHSEFSETTTLPQVTPKRKAHYTELTKATQNTTFVTRNNLRWPSVPKFADSNPAEAVGFLRVNKNPQHVGGHGCMSVVTVVCCQVEVSATN